MLILLYYSSKTESSSKGKASTGLSHSLFGSESLEGDDDDDDLFSGGGGKVHMDINV